MWVQLVLIHILRHFFFAIMEKTIFQKICDKDIPADIVYEDDQVLAFHDANPQAPTHVLMIPRKAISRVNDAQDEDKLLLGHLLLKAAEVARDLGCLLYTSPSPRD